MFGLETGELVAGAVGLAFVLFIGWKMFGPKSGGGTGGGGSSKGGTGTKLK